MKKQVLVKSAKEQFLNAVSDSKATYVAEVAGIHYYYDDDFETATMFVGINIIEPLYTRIKIPTIHKVIEQYGMVITRRLLDTFEDTKVIGQIINCKEGEIPSGRALALYCDAFFSNSAKFDILESVTYKDEYEEQDIPDAIVPEVSPSGIIGAEHTDINAISSMVQFLKQQIIDKIKTTFECMDENKFVFNPVFDNNSYFSDVAICGITEFSIQEKNGEILVTYDDDDIYNTHLASLLIEELLCIYSQLHN